MISTYAIGPVALFQQRQTEMATPGTPIVTETLIPEYVDEFTGETIAEHKDVQTFTPNVYFEKLIAAGRITLDEAKKKQVFINKGTLRFSNDGTKALLEEESKYFLQEDLEVCEFVGTQQEVLVYLEEHSSEWKSPDELTL